MKLATIFISILIVSAIFLTACQEQAVEPKGDGGVPKVEDTTPVEPIAEDINIVTEDEVDIGELI